jgi:hypothetical protein
MALESYPAAPPMMAELSSGVLVISKPPDPHVPPWRMVPALPGGEPPRVATWLANPEIPATCAATPVTCWDPSLGKAGAVEIATTGTWWGKTLGLDGVAVPDGNHVRIGVSTRWRPHVNYCGMSQQGSLSGPHCDSSRNCRGGLNTLTYRKSCQWHGFARIGRAVPLHEPRRTPWSGRCPGLGRADEGVERADQGSAPRRLSERYWRRTVLCRPGSAVVQERSRPTSGPDSATIGPTPGGSPPPGVYAPSLHPAASPPAGLIVVKIREEIRRVALS